VASPDEHYVDESLVNLVMGQFIASAKAGEVVWLTEHGEPIGAVAPLDVVRAGLRALGREG
jgi:antitoxin (DNA-binding transcriptional repressor) of toxin-antitoxin stability system